MYVYICRKIIPRPLLWFQGPAGLKGGEGPQGPPGPIVSSLLLWLPVFFLLQQSIMYIDPEWITVNKMLSFHIKICL